MKLFLARLLAGALFAGAATEMSAQTRPDLRAMLSGLSVTQAKPGAKFELTDETRNFGAGTPSSTQFEFWLGPKSDSTIGAIKLVPWTKNVKNLAAYETYVRPAGTRWLTIPSSATNRGAQFIIGIVRQVSLEANLANNTNSVALTIVAP